MSEEEAIRKVRIIGKYMSLQTSMGIVPSNVTKEVKKFVKEIIKELSNGKESAEETETTKEAVPTGL